jgi:uncharacterized membrane protein HdeD (DUF308 family)
LRVALDHTRWRNVISTASGTLTSPRTSSSLEPLRAKSGWIVLGYVYALAGIIALGSAVLATVASVFIVGVMLVIAGVTQVINAFQIRNWGKYLIWLLVGFLYIAAGFVSFESPLLVATLFTFLLGISLTASGTMRIFPAFNIREGMP